MRVHRLPLPMRAAIAALVLLTAACRAAEVANEPVGPASPRAAATAATAATVASAPRAATAASDDDEDVEIISHGRPATGFTWSASMWGALGSEHRLTGALARVRDHGDLVDGGLTLGLEQVLRPTRQMIAVAPREREVALTVGTDPQARREGELLVRGDLHEAGWHGELPVYVVEGSGGWSNERDGVATADVVVGVAHVGCEHDHAGNAYRLGLRYCSPPRPIRGEIGIDRIVSYQAGDERFLATETRALVWLPLPGLFRTALGGAYCRGTRDDGGEVDGVWQASLTLALRVGGAY